MDTSCLAEPIDTGDILEFRYHKRADRRHRTYVHKAKMISKAKQNKYIRGPWFNEDKQRVEIIDRGTRSKWLKRQAHIRVRRDRYNLYQRSQYWKAYDYWWELD